MNTQMLFTIREEVMGCSVILRMPNGDHHTLKQKWANRDEAFSDIQLIKRWAEMDVPKTALAHNVFTDKVDPK